MNESNDGAQRLGVIVTPNAEVLWADAAFRQDRGRLCHDQSRATDRAAAEMNEVPIVRVSVVARVLTHRRDEHPIGKRQISNRERVKQARHIGIDFSCWFRGLPSVLLNADINRNHRVATRLVNPISRMGVSNDLARLLVSKIERLAAVIEVFPSQAKEIIFDLFGMGMSALDVLHAGHN